MNAISFKKYHQDWVAIEYQSDTIIYNPEKKEMTFGDVLVCSFDKEGKITRNLSIWTEIELYRMFVVASFTLY